MRKKTVVQICLVLFICLLLVGVILFGGSEENTNIDDLNFQWVDIPRGNFTMGDINGSADKPTHLNVTISKGFQMLKYEVTQAQWREVMGRNPSNYPGDNRPVDTVSWNDCQWFISKMNKLDSDYTYRLPTEAEWEYSCRAGSKTDFCFGDNSSFLADYAWYVNNSDLKTHPVGQKQPNAWGLYDMHGNVWEWCQDWYDEDFYEKSPKIDPQGPTWGSSRVKRGGSTINPSIHCTSPYRNRENSHSHSWHHGFRIVRTLKTEAS